MMLNLYFFKVSVNKREVSLEEHEHNIKVQQIYDELKSNQIKYYLG